MDSNLSLRSTQCRFLGQPLSPIAWPSSTVRNCNDLYTIVRLSVHNEIKKPMKKVLPRAMQVLRPAVGKLSYSIERSSKLASKPPARCIASSLVPLPGALRFRDRLGMEPKFPPRHRTYQRVAVVLRTM